MLKALNKGILISKAKIGSRLNRPALSSVAYTASSLISRGASFLFTPFFTRLYTPTEFGAFSMFQSYLSILFILGSLEICSGVIIKLLISERENEDMLLLCATRIMLISASVTLGVFFALRYFLNENGFFGFSAALSVCALCRCVIGIYVASSKFHYGIRAIFAVNFAESLLPPIATLILYKLLKPKGIELVSIRALVYAAVLLLIAMPIFIKIRRQAKLRASSKASAELNRKILKSALPMLPYYLSMIVIAQGDKVLIGRLLGEGALAGYGIAYSLGSMLTMLSGGILAVLMPWISRKLRDGNIGITKEITKRLYLMSALITLIILCLAPELLSILAPKSYGNTLLPVFPIALSAPTLLLQTLNVTANLKYGTGLGVIVSGVLPAMLFVASAFFLAPHYGTLAIAVSLPFAYLFSFAISSWSLRQKMSNSLISANNYLQITLLMLILSGIIYQANASFLIRIATCIILLVTLAFLLLKSKSFIKERA